MFSWIISRKLKEATTPDQTSNLGSGLILVQEFINKVHLDQLLVYVPFNNDQRKYWQYSNGKLLQQWLLQDSTTNQLAKDPGLQL